MTIIDLIAPIVSALNTADEGQESNAPLFLYGPKSFQNLKDDVDVSNGVCYLDEPLISQDSLKTSGYIEEKYQLGILFGYRGAIDYVPADERVLIDKARERRRMFINLLSLSKIVRRITNIRTTDITKEYDLSLSGVFIQFDLTPINQLSNCTPEMLEAVEEAEENPEVIPVPVVHGCTNEDSPEFDPYATVDDGSCTLPGVEGITFDMDSALEITAIPGANLFESDIPDLAGWTAFAQEIGYKAFYFTIASPTIKPATTAVLNTFNAATNTQLVAYYPTRDSNTWNNRFALMDAMRTSWAALVGLVHDQESQSGAGTLPNSTFISRCAEEMAHAPELLHIWDTPPIEKSAPTGPSRLRLLAIQPRTDTNRGKVYRQIGDFTGNYSATDHAYNLAQLNKALNITLPEREDEFFALMTNISIQDVLQEHLWDTGKQQLSEMLANWAIGELTRRTLMRSTYGFLFFMKFQSLLTQGIRQPLFYAIKRVNQCYNNYSFSIPVTLAFSGCTVQGLWDGGDNYALLINNQTGIEHPITAADIIIQGKTVSGDFTNDCGYSDSLGGTATNQILTGATATVKMFGVNLIMFQAT